jgi:hypothetical protein
MATSAKNKLQAAKHERMVKGDEPTLRSENYQVDLLHALNYFNAHHDDKDKKKWFIHFVGKSDKKLAVQLNKLDEKLFRQAGVLARLQDTGSELMEKEALYFANKFSELKATLPKPEPTKKEVDASAAKDAANVVSIQERMLDKAREMSGEFEGLIDEFIINDKSFDAATVLKHYQISGPVAKLMVNMFDKTIAELEEVLDGNDEQLNEGYSHLKKTKIKKLLALYQSIGEACGLQVQVAKATRMPRKRKEKPAGVLVAKMKFKKEDTDYGIKSVLASGIINSQELWVFNTKYKKLQVYRAMDDKGLSVKGTTIIGYDPSNSGGRTLRKPELVKDYQAMGKRPLNAAYKALTTKEASVNGRVNEECILLKVF